MVECNKASAKLADSQLNKLNPAAKNRQSLTLKMNIKMFNWNNLSHELLSTTRKKLGYEMYLKIKCQPISRAQISKIIQYGWFIGSF